MNILLRFLLCNHVASLLLTGIDLHDMTRLLLGFLSWQGAGSPQGQMDWRWIQSHGFAKEACPGKCRYVYRGVNSGLQDFHRCVSTHNHDDCTVRSSQIKRTLRSRTSSSLLLRPQLLKALCNQSCKTASSTRSFQKLLQT